MSGLDLCTYSIKYAETRFVPFLIQMEIVPPASLNHARDEDSFDAFFRLHFSAANNFEILRWVSDVNEDFKGN